MEHSVKDDLWLNNDNKIYLVQKDFKNPKYPWPSFLAYLDIIQNNAIRLICPIAGDWD